MNSRVKRRHDRLRQWLGPVYGTVATFARFDDGGGSDAAVADAPAAAPVVSPSDGNLLTDAATPVVDDKPAPSAATVDDTTPADAAKTVLDNYALVKPDGSFIDNWHSSDLLPEELRGDDSLKVIKNLPDLAKRTVNAVKMIGKGKVVLPTEKSTDEEVASFWESVGKSNPSMARPKLAVDYKADIPDGMQSVFTDERVDAMKTMAFDIGATQTQFDSYMKHEMEATAKAMTDQEADSRRVQDETVLALKQEWGAAYDERLHVAKRLVAEAFGHSKEAELSFLQKFGNDPGFIRFAATVGARMVEDKALVAQLTNKTPTEALSKIKELEATPGYLDMGGTMSESQKSEITRQIREQYELAYPKQT